MHHAILPRALKFLHPNGEWGKDRFCHYTTARHDGLLAHNPGIASQVLTIHSNYWSTVAGYHDGDCVHPSSDDIYSEMLLLGP